MQRYFSRSKGQVTVEVAVLFGVVVAALVAMAAYVQRWSRRTGWSRLLTEGVA